MAVAKARLTEPLHAQTLPVTQTALVVGGGVAGMTAALALADQGFDTFLVEKSPRLGGIARASNGTSRATASPTTCAGLVRRVAAHPAHHGAHGRAPRAGRRLRGQLQDHDRAELVERQARARARPVKIEARRGDPRHRRGGEPAGRVPVRQHPAVMTLIELEEAAGAADRSRRGRRPARWCSSSAWARARRTTPTAPASAAPRPSRTPSA